MQSFQQDDMGLFTFYLQQIHEEDKKKAQTNNAQPTPLNYNTKNSPSRNHHKSHRTSNPFRIEQELKDKSVLQKLLTKSNNNPNRSSKTLTKTQEQDSKAEKHQRQGKVFSLGKFSKANNDYSSSATLKAHLKDLTTSQQIEINPNIGEGSFDYQQNHNQINPKTKSNSKIQRNKRLQTITSDLVLQLEAAVDRKRLSNNHPKANIVRNNLSNTVQFKQNEESTKFRLKKKGILPKLRYQFRNREQKKGQKMMPAVKHSKNLTEKWKNPRKLNDQQFLQPIMTERQSQVYPAIFDEFSPKPMEPNHRQLLRDIKEKILPLKKVNGVEKRMRVQKIALYKSWVPK